MSIMTSQNSRTRADNPLVSGKLPFWFTPAVLVVTLVILTGILVAMDSANIFFILIFGVIIYLAISFVVSSLVEGSRKAKDRLAYSLVTIAFICAVLPLISLLWTTVIKGLARFDIKFFTYSMRNVVGEGGGAVHAIYGTLYVTGLATLISVPIGLLAAIYLVEYGRGRLAKLITFFVDVMTGIPSIVAGLFAYAMMTVFLGPGALNGLSGAISLSVLMIPTVVRAGEEMLRIVPNELREASYALGVPKWRTIMKVVLPTAFSGIISGVILAIARIIGETAPLMVAAGFTQSVNNNPFAHQMMTLPVFVYDSFAHPGSQVDAYLDRAWTGALTLILIVMLLNLVGRLIARRFGPVRA